MSWIKTLLDGWRRLRSAVEADHPQSLLEILSAEYRDAAYGVAQLRQYAERMYYPHFRACLLEIAAEEHSEVEWLQEKIRTLGGSPVRHCFSIEGGKNSWACLRMALEEKQRSLAAQRSRASEILHIDPDTAKELLRIRKKEQQRCQVLISLVMRSAPDAIPYTTTQQEGAEDRKPEWLEQRKSKWLAQRQKTWEGAGRPEAWSEWLGEQEFVWETIELPHQELAWAKHLIEDSQNQ